MWKRLPSSVIDKQAWDTCVNRDVTGLVYALSWYLDAVAPGWEGWVKEENNEYVAVMPLTKRKIIGFTLISQPLLTQQLGLFTSKPNRRVNWWRELAPVLLQAGEAIEQYTFRPVDYLVTKTFLPLEERTNFILPLNQEYAAIKASYRSNRLRDLKKAATANLQLQSGYAFWPQVYALYQEIIIPRLDQRQQIEVKKIITRLVKAAMEKKLAQTVIVTLPSGQIVAGVFFLHYKNRLIYLLPVTANKGKSIGANTYLLDQVCQQFAGSNTILDFEGSSLPGLAHFYASLGGQPEPYGLLENFNFTVPLKILYTFKNWLKHWRSSTDG